MANTNITQPSFSSGIISTELFSRIDFSKVTSGLKECLNWVVRPAGGVIYRVGTRYIATTKYPLKQTSLIPFVFNRKDSMCLEFGDGYIRFYKNGEQIKKNNAPYEVVTTYTESEVSQIKFAQNKNDMYLTHPNHPPKVLHRTSDDNWTLRDLKLNPDVPTVSQVNIKSNTAKDSGKVVKYSDWQYAVSVVDKDGHESLPTYSGKIENDIDLLNQSITVSFSRPANHSNIDKFNIYRIKGGDFFLCYVLKYEDKENFSFTDISFAVDTTVTPKEAFDSFSEGNYPSAVGIHNQRLVLANTPKKPYTFWMSRVGEMEDFTKTPYNSADDAIELTFNSGTVDAITDIIPMDDMIVFTEGKIWRVTGTKKSDLAAYIESYSGSCGLRPFATKKSILYVDSSKNTVSNFVYSYELNGYSGQNLDILARDLLDGYYVKDVSFRDTPYGVMYAVRSDGVLLGLTYLREENIYAWHKHKTQGGFFRNICSVDSEENDNVYTVVERNGQCYVEMFGSYINNIQDINDSWHLDCATRVVSNWQKWKNETKTSTSKNFKAYKGLDKTEESVITYYAFQYGAGGSYAQYGKTTEFGEGDCFVYIKDGLPSVAPAGVKETDFVRASWRSDMNVRVPSADAVFRYSKTTQPQKRDIYVEEVVSGATVYVRDGDDFVISGVLSGYDNNYIYFDGFKYQRNTSLDFSEQSEQSVVSYRYTEGDPVVGGSAYDSVDKGTVYTVTSVSGNNIVIDGVQYKLESKSEACISEVNGLERFNGRAVYVLADTNVYRDLVVENGKIILDYPAKNVLVGLPYDGIIETIPQELKYSSGNSTVGINRKVNDGVLSYYRSRGLWYGRDIDKLYEVKPYTQDTYGENIPLETGKLTLKVADGFSSESSFVVVQKNPFPALVQSITLGSTYNGKN